MDDAENAGPSFPQNAFAGTAPYYIRYRPAYPRPLLEDLMRSAGVSGQGRLLDLASGPGRVALSIALSFREIWAVDLEPEMIAAGRLEAERLGMKHIRWITGRAEELDAPDGSMGLVTVGEAFHRLEQRRVCSRILRWLEAGRCMVILGSYSILSEREPWQQMVASAVRRWTDRIPKDGAARPGAHLGGPDHDMPVLLEAGFVNVASQSFVEPREWTVDEVIGYLYSTSVCSKAALGRNAEEFEAHLRASLLEYDSCGTYRESLQWGYTLGRKPA